jgi:hypothetical protein
MPESQPIPLLEETISRLLESQNPSIRFWTLAGLLGKSPSDPQVLPSRAAIATSPPISRILSAQHPDGSWVNARHVYSPKYRSAHWTMLLLSELGIDSDNPGFRFGADFMMVVFQKDQPDYLKRKEHGFGCFWGNWLRYQLYAGSSQDPYVGEVVAFVCEDLKMKGKCRYNANLPCAWAVIRDLYALALLPEQGRNEQVRQAIQAGLAFVLEEYDLLAADYPHEEKIHPTWFKLNFPLFYHTDILFTLRVLKEFNMLSHPAAVRARQWLLERRKPDGTWHASSPFRDRTWYLAPKTEPLDDWTTLHALSVLC